MPNYGTVRYFCNLMKKEASCTETYVAEPKGDGKFVRQVDDCMSKEEGCRSAGCKFSGGTCDPFAPAPA